MAHHWSLFRFRSSPSGPSGSSARSAAIDGFSSECTLLAMLDRRVAGIDSTGRGNLGPPIAQLLSGWDGSRKGGVTCLDCSCCRRGPPSSYRANASRTCWSEELWFRPGEEGHCMDGLGPYCELGEGPADGGQPCCLISADVWRRARLGPGGDETDDRGWRLDWCGIWGLL